MPDSFTILLPWPSPKLSPNGRAHHMELARLKKSARHDGRISALAAGAKKLDWKAVDARWTFYPPTAHKRDDDNLTSRVKAYRDGVSDAIGIDDANWTSYPPIIAGTVKGGAIELVIEKREAVTA